MTMHTLAPGGRGRPWGTRLSTPSVDDHFRLSAPVETITTKDTTQVGPRITELELHPRAWPIELRTRPDMRRLEPTPDTTSTATCPTCGALAQGEAFHAMGQVRFIDYLCGNGHIWQTKWMQGGAA